MTHYTITQQASGIILFHGEAISEQDALDRMARDAGYADYASIPDEIDGGDTLIISEHCNPDDAIAAIRNAKNLRRLLDSLQDYEDALNPDDPIPRETRLRMAGIDICELPHFGGDEPSNTLGVWSWDEDRLLVGEGPFSDWRIVDREDWN